MSFIERKKAAVHKMHGHIMGRQTEIAAVKYSLKQMQSRLQQQKVKDYANIFYFYGMPGTGKSTLLQAVYQDCDQGELGARPLTVWLDFNLINTSQSAGREAFLVALTHSILELSQELVPYFQPLLARWERFNQEASAPTSSASQVPAAPPAAAPAPRRNATSSAYATMAGLQGAGNRSVQSIARSVNRNMQAVQAGQHPTAMRGPATQMTTPEVLNELLDLFVKAVDKISTSYPVLFVLDHYEKFAHHDAWFRQHFLMAFQRELVVAIGSQENLHEAFKQSFGKVASCVRLRPFNVFETGLYLKQNNRLQDPALVQAVQDLTGGVPVALAMVSSAFQHTINRSTPAQLKEFLAYPDVDYGDQIDKYIAYISLDEFPTTDKNMLATLAIMRDFQPELFQQLSGVLNVKRTLEHLAQRYPFVTPNGHMSDFVSRTLRGYFKQELPSLFTEINQGAYAYYMELIQAHPDEASLFFESLYYYFHLDAHKAYQNFIQLVSHYLHKDLDMCDEVCLAALEASIPKSWREEVLRIVEGLGGFRKKDAKSSQVVLAAISNTSPPSDDNFYLNYIEAIS